MDYPYVVEIDGVPVRCQTPQDAIALVRASGGAAASGEKHRQSNQPQAHNGTTRWTDQRVAEFFKNVEGKQRKLIDELLQYDERTDDQLVSLLGLANGPALGGVLSGLWKNAKKVGADPNELCLKKSIMIGDKRGYEYSLSPGFRQAAARRAAAAK
jgi:hypothetical protein